MARNKHPEETVEKILDVSYRLFLSRGFEHTTIQDIVDALGMSKGAIYHHFKSKEDILDKITDQYYQRLSWFSDPASISGANGLEKMRYAFCYNLTDTSKLEMDHMMLPLLHNPRLIALSIQSTFLQAAPYMERLLQEAIADGSAPDVRFPHELSQAFILLINVWVGMFGESRESLLQKLLFCRDMLEHFGLPLIDEALIQTVIGYYDRMFPG
ncbi:TetR/AcrR family transcriptional regulator [Pseudoflavonifractor sp. 524-17]|uniref:TetR/AcrR family transcriptional regulator n=1 Tax=Pseudoflavonifractor sp. 524-17 TaxID=2304577 RepID=UPI0013798C62|nr:TetR/AcrR family transcriptional regulator [Pseudoflavonifractor sp. 524-17]NCE64868.1 TetR/AcrR family transcriptional regulator [Pseudoflavonifractor sp. 524-17]